MRRIATRGPRVASFEKWDDRLKAAKAPIEALWDAVLFAKPKTQGTTAKSFDPEQREPLAVKNVDPLKLKLKSDIFNLGEEPPEGPRFSKRIRDLVAVPTRSEPL